MACRIIRLASDYGLAIAVTPEDAVPDGLKLPEGATFHRWADWRIGAHEPCVWNELRPDGVWGYFSGHADGLGFAEIPADPFPDLAAAEAWLRENRDRAARERMAELEALKAREPG